MALKIGRMTARTEERVDRSRYLEAMNLDETMAAVWSDRLVEFDHEFAKEEKSARSGSCVRKPGSV